MTAEPTTTAGVTAFLEGKRRAKEVHRGQGGNSAGGARKSHIQETSGAMRNVRTLAPAGPGISMLRNSPLEQTLKRTQGHAKQGEPGAMSTR